MKHINNLAAQLENTQSYIETPKTTFQAIRTSTADNTDGTVTLIFNIDPSDMPAALATSPDGSLWRIGFPNEIAETSIIGMRQSIRDAPKNRVLIRFTVNPTSLPTNLIWGRTRETCILSLQMLAGRHPYPHFVQRAERAACLQRAAMMCSDPQFGEWLEILCKGRNIPIIENFHLDPMFIDSTMTEQRLKTSEYLCRLAGIHSKREITGSNAAAERVETLIRNYRDYIWNQNKENSR